jgi:hypothetical protein
MGGLVPALEADLRSCPRIADVHRASEKDVLEALKTSTLKAGCAEDHHESILEWDEYDLNSITHHDSS